MTEHDHQVAVFEWAALHEKRMPGLALLYAVPNGGKRHPGVARKLKREGVKRGVPDMCLPVARGGYHGLYIELKKPGGRVTEHQKRWISGLTAQKYLAVVCFGWEQSVQQLTDYLNQRISLTPSL